MRLKDLLSLLNIWTVLGSLITALFLITLFIVGIWLSKPVRSTQAPAPAALTVIPAPTSTPLPPTNSPLGPVLQPTQTALPGEVFIGGFVQISGTGGDGLRLRSSPGLNATPLFLGFESEVFEVREGPQDLDGFTWWYLVAPYDETRSGWAAASFLSVIPTP